MKHLDLDFHLVRKTGSEVQLGENPGTLWGLRRLYRGENWCERCNSKKRSSPAGSPRHCWGLTSLEQLMQTMHHDSENASNPLSRRQHGFKSRRGRQQTKEFMRLALAAFYFW